MDIPNDATGSQNLPTTAASIVSTLATATPITSEIVSDFEPNERFEMTPLEKASFDCQDIYFSPTLMEHQQTFEDNGNTEEIERTDLQPVQELRDEKLNSFNQEEQQTVVEAPQAHELQTHQPEENLEEPTQTMSGVEEADSVMVKDELENVQKEMDQTSEIPSKYTTGTDINNTEKASVIESNSDQVQPELNETPIIITYDETNDCKHDALNQMDLEVPTSNAEVVGLSQEKLQIPVDCGEPDVLPQSQIQETQRHNDQVASTEQTEINDNSIGFIQLDSTLNANFSVNDQTVRVSEIQRTAVHDHLPVDAQMEKVIDDAVELSEKIEKEIHEKLEEAKRFGDKFTDEQSSVAQEVGTVDRGTVVPQPNIVPTQPAIEPKNESELATEFEKAIFESSTLEVNFTDDSKIAIPGRRSRALRSKEAPKKTFTEELPKPEPRPRRTRALRHEEPPVETHEKAASKSETSTEGEPPRGNVEKESSMIEMSHGTTKNLHTERSTGNQDEQVELKHENNQASQVEEVSTECQEEEKPMVKTSLGRKRLPRSEEISSESQEEELQKVEPSHGRTRALRPRDSLKRSREEDLPKGEPSKTETPKKQIKKSRGSARDHTASYEATKNTPMIKLPNYRSRATISSSDPISRFDEKREATSTNPVQKETEKKFVCSECGYATDRLNNQVYHSTKSYCRGKLQMGEVMKADIIRQQQQAKAKRRSMR